MDLSAWALYLRVQSPVGRPLTMVFAITREITRVNCDNQQLGRRQRVCEGRTATDYVARAFQGNDSLRLLSRRAIQHDRLPIRSTVLFLNFGRIWIFLSANCAARA